MKQKNLPRAGALGRGALFNVGAKKIVISFQNDKHKWLSKTGVQQGLIKQREKTST